MKQQLGLGKKVIANCGYKGDTKVCAPDDWKDETQKKAMGRLRARHETLNGRLKNWGCLAQIYRHNRDKHHLIVKAILVIAQIAISSGNPLFQVTLYHDSPLV